MEFRVLGPFEAVASRKVLPLGGQTQRAVLAVLVVRAREVVPTGAIVEAVWPGDPPGTAVGLVRTYVSRLRTVLSAASNGHRQDTVLVTRPPGYVLEVAPEQVDATRFEQLVRQARQEASAGRLPAAVATMGDALDLWRGQMLADLDVLQPLRPLVTRLEQLRLAALEERIDAQLALGQHAEVVPELEMLTAELPFRERLWGQLIVALYRMGRQAEALSTYQTLRSNLTRQLGIEPTRDLQALERDILQHAEDVSWSPPGAPQQAGPLAVAEVGRQIPLPPALGEDAHGQPLAGRTAERALLSRSLETARAGRFNAVLVAGPPGIGKTALVARFACDAYGEGLTVVRGQADEGAPLPFQGVREALHHWASSASADDLDLLGDDAAARLARILPSLRGRLDGLPSAPNEGDEADRHLLLEAVAHWFAVLATTRPAVMVLEDLQWADQATLLAVRHLLRHPPPAGTLLVATYRDTEPSNGNGLAELLAGTRASQHVVRMDLSGLADGEVAELLQAEVGHDIGSSGRAFAADLNQRAGGNPLFIHETLRHLTERGAIVPAANQWGDRELIEGSGVPGGVREVIEQRLRRLPEETTKVLRHASVLGDHFDLPVLSRLVDASQLAVVEALEPAVVAGLVGPLGARSDCFAFSHALVREAIFEGLPLGLRARAHWQAGQVIASLHAAYPEPRLGEIAHHLATGVSAGDPHTAISANVDAGTQALGALAFEDALVRFRTATDLLDATGVADPELTYTSWSGQASAAGAAGVWDDRLRDGYLRSASIAREQGWHRRLAHSAIGFTAFSATYGDMADNMTAQDLVNEALARLDSSMTVERALLLTIKANIAILTDRSGELRAVADEVDRLAASGDDPTAQAIARAVHCAVLAGGPHPAKFKLLAEQVMAYGGQFQARVILHTGALAALGVSSLQLGDRTAYEDVRARVAAGPETRRSAYLAGCLRWWDAAVALSGGRFDEAESLVTDVAGPGDWSIWWDTVVAFQRGVADIERGRHAHTRDYLRDVLAAVSDDSAPATLALLYSARATLALLYAEVGDTSDAARQIEVLRRDPRRLRIDALGLFAAPAYRCLAELAVRLDDRDLAADLLPEVSRYSGQLLTTYSCVGIHGAADRAIGQLLLTLGRCHEAVERLAAAHAFERSFGADALATRTTYWHARARLARDAPGDHEAARRLLHRASADAKRLGMAQLEQDAGSLLLAS